MDRSDLLDRFLRLLRDENGRFCVIGGQAVNAYVDPVVSLDLDIVIAAQDLERLKPILERQFSVEQFSHRVKDLADIARLLDVRPELRARVPREILDRLI